MTEDGKEGLGDAEGTDAVYGEDIAEGIAGDGVFGDHGCVIDKYVETAVGGEDVADGGVDGGIRGYVNLDWGDGAFEGEGLKSGGGCGSFRMVAAAEQDVVGW